MDQAAPWLVVILTGHLPAIIGAAAILTWPIGLALLALYRRAVRRSMGSRASGDRNADSAGQAREVDVDPVPTSLESGAAATASITAASAPVLAPAPARAPGPG